MAPQRSASRPPEAGATAEGATDLRAAVGWRRHFQRSTAAHHIAPDVVANEAQEGGGRRVANEAQEGGGRRVVNETQEGGGELHNRGKELEQPAS